MSAFLCSDRHIATIAVNYCRLTKTEDAQRIANELKALNVISVNFRYPNHEPEPIEPCSLDDIADALSFPDLVAICDCLDHQSCDPPDYKNPLLDAITAQFKANCRHAVKSPLWRI